MRNIMNKVSAASARMSAAATIAVLAFADSAHAQGASGVGVGGMSNQVDGQLTSVGKLLLGGSFLGGIGLCGAGLMNLKKAADSQGRESYGPGMWRCAVGAGLVGLPTFSQTFRDTFTGGTGTSNLGVGNATFQ